jgi:hypothetical protein
MLIPPRRYVPFGNAYYAIAPCSHFTYPDLRFCWANATFANKPGVFDGKLVCQHGEGECTANLMEACVIAHEPDWKKTYPFLQCYEGAVESGVTTGVAEKCAKATGLDIAKATACSTDPKESVAVTQAAARKTCALQPGERLPN